MGSLFTILLSPELYNLIMEQDIVEYLGKNICVWIGGFYNISTLIELFLVRLQSSIIKKETIVRFILVSHVYTQ